MNATFDKRLQKQNVMSRLGHSNIQGGRYGRQPVSDLRSRIGNVAAVATVVDARNMLNRRRRTQQKPQRIRHNMFSPNNIGGVALQRQKDIPFLIPRRTVKNDYFNRSLVNNSRITRQKRSQFRQNKAPLIRTIINQPTRSASTLPALFGSLPLQTAGFLQLSQTPTGHVLSPIQGFRVEIKNFLPSVTLEDVYELFSGVGSVRSCNLVRPGHAEVIFTNAPDALSAVTRYNGRELDGRPMKVTLTTPTDAVLPQPGHTKISADNRSSAAALRGRLSKQPVEIDMEVVNRALHHITSPSVSMSRRPVDFNVNLF